MYNRIKKAEIYKNEGTKYYEKQDYKKAALYYSKAISKILIY